MPKKTKTIIITGTHLTPALELIRQLKNDSISSWNIHYLGRLYTSSVDSIPTVESTLIPSIGINFHPITGGKFDRRYFPNTIAGIPKIFQGLFQSFTLVKQIRPDIVISFGGYISVPVIISAKLLKIPSISHEQTLTVSLSTKINSYFANITALSFENTKKFLPHLPPSRISVTGNLLRQAIFTDNSPLFSKLIPHPKLPLIYVTAGNQGSTKINQVILSALSQLTKKYIIIHQTGKLDFVNIRKSTANTPNYYPIDYINPEDIGWVFHHASLIISRSGANASQEIDLLNIPSILIPLPVTQQNEQKLNAAWVQKNHPQTTIILDNQSLTPQIIIDSVNKLSCIPKSIIKPGSKENTRLLELIHETC